MTKFDELMDIITHNKKFGRKTLPSEHEKILSNNEDDDIELEVSGSETRGPLVAEADEQLDPDLVDMLYTKPRNIPNRGEGASSWDSDY